jgi:peptide/nickel transport system substrate-binding protein
MSYWQSQLSNRLSRRRALGLTAAGIGSAAFLAACGGGSDDKSSSGAPKGESLLAKVDDTTAKATPGGTWSGYLPSDTPGLDPMTNPASTVPPLANFALSRLLKYKAGTRQDRPTGIMEGDAATSWEVAPDGLTMTMKLRPGMKYDARPPTNGKNLTAEDVLFSWKQFETLSGTRTALSNKADPGAPILSMTAPDPMTVVAKMAFPYAPLLPMLGYHWYLVIQPTEADGKFNAKQDMRGSGPWLLDKYTPSSTFEFVKNPNWYVKDRPFLDRINLPIVTEYATGLSQFEAGNIWNYNVNQLDVISVRKRNAGMQMLLNDAFNRTPPQVVGFGYKADSPFRDVRLRQAVSMMIDRDALIELNTSPSVFTREGFDVPQRVHTHISAGEEGRWLDPKGKELGDGAKNLALNIEEAKKLLKAAAFEGKEVTFTYFATNRYSNAWPKQGEVLMDMITQGGIKIKPNVVDYDTEYNPRYLNGKANYDGLAMLPSSAGPDIDTHFASKYTVNGRATYIAEPLGPITELITAQRKEFDTNKRNAIIKDIQKQLAMQMAAVPVGGLSLDFALQWPYLGNRGWFLEFTGTPNGPGAAATELYPYFWLDKSKTKA